MLRRDNFATARISTCRNRCRKTKKRPTPPNPNNQILATNTTTASAGGGCRRRGRVCVVVCCVVVLHDTFATARISTCRNRCRKLYKPSQQTQPPQVLVVVVVGVGGLVSWCVVWLCSTTFLQPREFLPAVTGAENFTKATAETDRCSDPQSHC
jgi:hypothetical protein